MLGDSEHVACGEWLAHFRLLKTFETGVLSYQLSKVSICKLTVVVQEQVLNKTWVLGSLNPPKMKAGNTQDAFLAQLYISQPYTKSPAAPVGRATRRLNGLAFAAFIAQV